MGKRRGRPSADLPRSAAGQSTSFIEPPATLGDVLLNVEINLKESGRRLEWAAVTHPAFRRESEIVFMVARRVRGERLRLAA